MKKRRRNHLKSKSAIFSLVNRKIKSNFREEYNFTFPYDTEYPETITIETNKSIGPDTENIKRATITLFPKARTSGEIQVLWGGNTARIINNQATSFK